MVEVTVELDDVQETILDKISEPGADLEDAVQEVFDDGLFRVYQRWKMVEKQAESSESE